MVLISLEHHAERRGLTGCAPYSGDRGRGLRVCASASFRGPRHRPQGSAEPRPLLPGIGAWIFGENLGPPCGVANVMDPATYKTELCGVRVLFGGIPARLLYTKPDKLT